MYIIKNAIKNLGRNLGRNILTGFITLAIILAVTVSIVINTTVSSITNDYKAKFGAEVTLFFDSEKANGNTDIQAPSAEQQMAFSESETLKETKYEASLSIVLKELKALNGDKAGNATMNLEGGDQLQPTAKIIASSDPNISDAFVSGKRSLIHGSVFKAANECIISDEFATLNNLNVNDKITVTNTNEHDLMPNTFVIRGIYKDHVKEDTLAFSHPLFSKGNEIITSMDTILSLDLFKARGSLISTYFLKKPDLLKQFQQELSAKGLPSYYRATIDEQMYQKVVGPVEGISTIVTTFMFVVLLFGSVLLLFLSIMSIRERKYEIGVLRAMGLKRIKIIYGMVSESLLIVGLCLVIGLGVSNTLSQPIADALLSNQLQIAQEKEDNASTMQLLSNDDAPNVISEISVKLTSSAMLEIISLAFALAIVSSMSAILYITRYEPMKILSERN